MSTTNDIPYGLCHCGCGERTNLSPKAYGARGIKAGDPFQFINGHQKRLPFEWNAEDRGYVTPCHIWRGRLNHHGYGVGPRRNGKQSGAHRIAWADAHGPIPRGLSVLHHCDVPACVNADHLFLGTRADNVADMVAKGRGRSVTGEQHPRTTLSTAQIEAIRRVNGLSAREIAGIAGCSESTVAKIRRGDTRRSG